MSKNRFKFRAYITSIISEGEDKEKEVGFYIEDVAVYSDGGIGFDRDSLLNALYKLDLTESQRDEIEEYLSENGYSLDYEWFAVELGIVEQCTGLKDKNGKLIYEGDIVIIIDKSSRKEPFIGVVEYTNTASFEANCNGFYMHLHNPKTPENVSMIEKMFCTSLREIKVIGNIHENPELLEVQDE